MNHRPVIAAIIAAIASLALAAALTPEQSPILPLELGLVLLAVGGWVLVRSSRPALVTALVVGLAMTALSVHIFLGDVGSSGAREVVPDVLVLLAALGMVATSARALAGRTFVHAS